MHFKQVLAFKKILRNFNNYFGKMQRDE